MERGGGRQAGAAVAHVAELEGPGAELLLDVEIPLLGVAGLEERSVAAALVPMPVAAPRVVPEGMTMPLGNGFVMEPEGVMPPSVEPT